MHLTLSQVERYHTEGYLLCEDGFSPREVDLLRAQLPIEFAEDSPRRVVEKDSRVVRSVYGSHATNQILGDLAHHPRLVAPARQLLADDVYVYQFKINAKAAFVGDVWEWHQDYVFWRNEDGMPAPDVINCVVFLDDVTEFNGPMYVIPGSHTAGVVEQTNGDADPGGAYRDSPAWISSLTARLKYSLPPEVIARFVARSRIEAPKGRAGSILFFHPNLLHASPPNLSPFDRALCFVTYNSVRNVPVPVGEPRPAFLVARDRTAIEPAADDVLLRHARVVETSA